MKLCTENYHSLEAKIKYMSASRYKDFCGANGLLGCEAKAIAVLEKKWEVETTPAMKVSSYVDAHFAGTLDTFKAKNPEIFTKKGELLSAYKKAEEIVARVERDEYFMRFMSGEKQVIMTAEMFGAEWSIAIDSYLPGTVIVDLKCLKSLTETLWTRELGRISFVEFYGYIYQGAIYQEVVFINTGKRLPFFIAGVSKEKEPDIEIIGINNAALERALDEIESNMPRILKLKAGEIEPDRCGKCDYCRNTKKLSAPIHFLDLVPEG